MTNRNTRRALLASLMALILCVSSLLGTTYAWFTDEVTSSNNKIVAGNLDVELEYYDTDNKKWIAFDDQTNVFKENTLWEPGHTEVVYLKVSNLGSLALKYNLGVNIASETAGINAAGATFFLSNYIEFGAIETETENFYADRDAARKAVTDAKIISHGFSKSSVLVNKGDTEYVALVVYMPETVGNEANFKGGTNAPVINLGIKVFATQYTAEDDSFDNQYDADAAFSVWDGTVPTQIPTTLVVDPTTRTITINDAAAFAYLGTHLKNWVATYSNGLGTDYSNYSIVNGGKGNDYYYTWGWDVKFNCDIDLNNHPWTPLSLESFRAVDGQGHIVKNVVVEGTDNAGLFSVIPGGIANITVVNAQINATGNSVGAVVGTSHGTISNVNVSNSVVTGNKYVGGIVGYGYANVINSSVYGTVVAIPETGIKEAGGLAGYLCNKTYVNGNKVEDCVISAPTVASALVSQPNGKYEIKFNLVKNTIVTTLDDTADIFVSNNVGGTSVVSDNVEVGCTVNKSGSKMTVLFADDGDSAMTNAKAAGYKEIVVVGAEFDSKLSIGSDVNATLVNCTITGNNAWGYAKNVTFRECTFDSGSDAPAIHFDQLYGHLTVEDCEFKSGKVQIGTNGSATAEFINCVFSETETTSIWAEKGMRMYAPTVFRNCEFNNRVVLAGSTGLSLTFENCTMNGGSPVYYVDNTDGIIRGSNIPVVTIK